MIYVVFIAFLKLLHASSDRAYCAEAILSLWIMYNIMKAFEGNHIFGGETLLKDDEWPRYSTKYV